MAYDNVTCTDQRDKVKSTIAGTFCALIALGVVASGTTDAPARSGATPTNATTYSLTAPQAHEIATAIEFVRAFNGGRIADARKLISPSVIIGDCDYARVRAEEFRGVAGTTRWLRERHSDRDRLALGRLYNDNADAPSGALAVEVSRRTSNTLRRLGFPSGIVPKNSVKILFSSSTAARIRSFSIAPGGANAEFCRPTP